MLLYVHPFRIVIFYEQIRGYGRKCGIDRNTSIMFLIMFLTELYVLHLSLMHVAHNKSKH